MIRSHLKPIERIFFDASAIQIQVISFTKGSNTIYIQNRSSNADQTDLVFLTIH